MNVLAVTVSAQAKINLHLRVFSRDESGFHPIETIFHRIDLADEVLVSAATSERTIGVYGDDTGAAESNLAFRAAIAYSNQAGWPEGFRIEIEKRIPVGAGLGGGSADAAAVLRGLDAMAPEPLGEAGLLRIAATLGSDVPFLTSEAVMALAWDRGERILALPPLPRRDILLAVPGFPVSTGDAYRWLDESRATADPGSSHATEGHTGNAPEPFVLQPDSLNNWESIAQFARNDFEKPVFGRYGELRSHIERLKNSGALIARMTGSGSTLFGVFDSLLEYLPTLTGNNVRTLATTTASHVVQPVRVG